MAAIESMPQKKISEQKYYVAQLIFWGGYFCLNQVFMLLWGSISLFTLSMFFCLSCLMALSSHGLRALYHRVNTRLSLLHLSLHLIWLLPLLALANQALLFLLIYGFYYLFPSDGTGNQPATWGGFLAYSMNTCIMFLLWSCLYLLRAEFTQRRNTEIEYWRAQTQLRDAELHMLRSQINSHFLFNALNNLRSLITENPEAARKGLADLATLLRGLLHSNNQPLIHLKDELEWVHGYLALEKLQFEQRLAFEFDIDESLHNAELPPLLLQTLVENAIKHGIAARRAGGSIQIQAVRLSDSRWQLCVTNPPAEFTSPHVGQGIGLENLRERLARAYGTQASLALSLKDTVCARVELPL